MPKSEKNLNCKYVRKMNCINPIFRKKEGKKIFVLHASLAVLPTRKKRQTVKLALGNNCQKVGCFSNLFSLRGEHKLMSFSLWNHFKRGRSCNNFLSQRPSRLQVS
jgi:hypothetical protein